MYLIDKCTVVFSIKICTNKLISANCPYLSLLEAKKKIIRDVRTFIFFDNNNNHKMTDSTLTKKRQIDIEK